MLQRQSHTRTQGCKDYPSCPSVPAVDGGAIGTSDECLRVSRMPSDAGHIGGMLKHLEISTCIKQNMKAMIHHFTSDLKASQT